MRRTSRSVLGVAAGLIPAVGMTALLADSLMGVTMADPIAIGGVMAMLTTVALSAAYVPGPPRRAGGPVGGVAQENSACSPSEATE